MEPGETAPEFELPDQDGETVRLAGLRGRIAAVLRRVKPAEHDERALPQLREAA